MQTRAMDMVAGSQEPPNTSAVGRCMLPCRVAWPWLHRVSHTGTLHFRGPGAALWPPHCCASTIQGLPETVPRSEQVPGSSDGAGSTQGAGEGWPESRDPRMHPEPGCLSLPRRLCFLTAFCILSTSAIDMGLEHSHTFLRLGQGLCGPVFQGESPLPLCSWWQKGPLCASGSVLLWGRIGTKQPQLGRK